MNDFYYIAHGGPGSGRYPLGSGERPYQKFEGSRKKSSGISGYIKSIQTKKQEEQKQKAIEEARKRETARVENERRLEADKERVLREGSPVEVMRYQGRLTNKELNDVAERLRLENQISQYSEKQIQSSLDNLKKLQSYTNVGSSLAKDGIDLWNSLASIYNATPPGQENPLPLISKGDKKKDK